MRQDDLFAEVDEHIGTLFGLDDSVLAATERSLAAAGMPEISVSPVHGRLLQVLALSCNAKRILEIGTLAGYSTICLARALPEDGHITTIEFDPRHADIALENIRSAGLKATVDVRVGGALDILPQLVAEGAGPYDLVFIDADKAPYAEYFEWSLRLGRPGTLIVGDNAVREGRILDRDADDESVRGIQRFNEALASHPGVTGVVVQTVGAKGHDGMALAVVGAG